MQRPYSIRLGRAQCSACNKSIVKSYTPIGSVHPYGSECIKKIVGLDIPSEELSVPVWLLEIAERYVKHRLVVAQSTHTPIEVEDFPTNFYNDDFGVTMELFDKHNESLVENRKPIKIAGKTVKVGWQDAIMSYLINRRIAIEDSLTHLINHEVTCPVCLNHMHYTGESGNSEYGQYVLYRCLSARSDCTNSANNTRFAYFGGYNVVQVPSGTKQPVNYM